MFSFITGKPLWINILFGFLLIFIVLFLFLISLDFFTKHGKTLTIPEIILTESFLSYLGLGVQEPQTSLGTLISFGAPVAETLPWMLIGPAVVLVTLLLCLTYIGDGLRDALDPKDR